MPISLRHIAFAGLVVANCTVVSFPSEAQGVHVSVASPSKSPSPRADATLTLKLQEDESATVTQDNTDLTASLSVSVVNNGQTEVDTTNGGIEAYLLLTSDIRGYVENAGYYFESNDSIHARSLDDLLLTQGWSRFDVSEVAMGGAENISQDETHYYMERGLFLSGYVKTFLGKPVISAPVTIIGSNGIARQVTTDETGHFLEEDIWYDMGTRFVVQAINTKGRSNIELHLDEPEFKTLSPFTPLSLFTTESDRDFYAKHGKSYIFADNGERITTIGVVKVGAMSTEGQKKQFFEDFIVEDVRNSFLLGFTGVRNFGNGPDGSNPRFYTELEWAIRNHKKMYAFGIEYFDGEHIESIPLMSEELKSRWVAIQNSTRKMNGEGAQHLEYVDPNSFPKYLGTHFSLFGVGVSSAIGSSPIFGIANSTRTEISWNMQTVVPFSPQRVGVEFYKPSYDVPTELLKEPVDEKITRYWNPVVQLSSGETFSVTFPTADGAGNHSYTMTVEGLTSDGAPIHKTYRYEL